MSACMLIPHKGHTDTIQVYSVTVMTHVKALQAGHSSQGTSEPITPAQAHNSGYNRLRPLTRGSGQHHILRNHTIDTLQINNI